MIVANNSIFKKLGLDYSVQDWKEKRINAINRKISNNRKISKYNSQDVTEVYIDEYTRVNNSKAIDKREYKNEKI